MSSLVPRLPPSFPFLALRTSNDGKLDGAWERFQILRMNLAARTYRRQHEVGRSKKWQSSIVTEMVANPIATLHFCQLNLHDDGQPVS